MEKQHIQEYLRNQRQKKGVPTPQKEAGTLELAEREGIEPTRDKEPLNGFEIQR